MILADKLYVETINLSLNETKMNFIAATVTIRKHIRKLHKLYFQFIIRVNRTQKLNTFIKFMKPHSSFKVSMRREPNRNSVYNVNLVVHSAVLKLQFILYLYRGWTYSTTKVHTKRKLLEPLHTSYMFSMQIPQTIIRLNKLNKMNNHLFARKL